MIALRSTGDTLPLGAKFMGELVVGRLFFRYHHLAEIAVIPYGGTRNENRRRGMTVADKLNQLLGKGPPAAAQELFLFFRPALICDRFACQVDDGVKPVQILLLGQISPDVDTCAQHLARFLWTARHHGNVVMQRLQTRNEMATNQAGTAGQQNFHTTSGLRLALPA